MKDGLNSLKLSSLTSLQEQTYSPKQIRRTFGNVWVPHPPEHPPPFPFPDGRS